jgi:hypothetical protein
LRFRSQAWRIVACMLPGEGHTGLRVLTDYVVTVESCSVQTRWSPTCNYWVIYIQIRHMHSEFWTLCRYAPRFTCY